MDCGNGARARQHVFLLPGKHGRRRRRRASPRPASSSPGPARPESAERRTGMAPRRTSTWSGAARPPSALGPRGLTRAPQRVAPPCVVRSGAARPWDPGSGRDSFPDCCSSSWSLVTASCGFHNPNAKAQKRTERLASARVGRRRGPGLRGAATWAHGLWARSGALEWLLWGAVSCPALLHWAAGPTSGFPLDRILHFFIGPEPWGRP